ncbi:MAG: FtsH protease activity modulator HflK, partial [Limisphaerales bacterium]
GKFHKTAKPGLGFKLPFGIDSIVMVAVQRQLMVEFGFGTSGGTNRRQFSRSEAEQAQERNMVTGDLNAASVEFVVQYRISDPKNYLFKVYEPEETLRAAAESVMSEVIGDRAVDEVLTFGRQEIATAGKDRLQELTRTYELGLEIVQIQLREVNPPPQVRASFDEVIQSQQEAERVVNQANGEYNKTVPRTRGEAQGKISAAEGYATKRVNEAEGDAARFNAMFAEYQKAPDVTRRRIYLETMRDVLPQLDRKVILDSSANNLLPLLQLNAQGGAR